MPKTNDAYLVSDRSDSSSENHNTPTAASKPPAPTRAPQSTRRRGFSTTSNSTEKNLNNSNLFIRNLSSKIEQPDLEKLFSPFGRILSSVIIRNIHTGESLGTAFVRYETHAEAAAALASLNNAKFQGKQFIVQWAKKHEGAPVGEEREKILKLFIRNVPFKVTTESLTELFGAHGPIASVSIHKDTTPANGVEERRIAFVQYSEMGCAARAALAIHNTQPFAECAGIPLMVKLATDEHNSRQKSHTGSGRFTAHRTSAASLPPSNADALSAYYSSAAAGYGGPQPRSRMSSVGGGNPGLGYASSSSKRNSLTSASDCSNGNRSPSTPSAYRYDPYNLACPIVVF